MARLTEESLREQETIILWNEFEEEAELWTANPKVRKEWESFGFKPKEHGGGWRCYTPKSRITYKMLKK